MTVNRLDDDLWETVDINDPIFWQRGLSWDWINTRIACGGQVDSALDVRELSSGGITHVLDVRAEAKRRHSPNREADLIGGTMDYLNLGVNDDGRIKEVAWFAQGIQYALEALSVPGAKLYINCAAGINRAPSMCYAVLRALGMSSTGAEMLMNDQRPETRLGLAYREDADKAIQVLGYA